MMPAIQRGGPMPLGCVSCTTWSVSIFPRTHRITHFVATMFWNGEGNMPMQEIWDLQLSSKVTPAERLTMQSMMDKAYFLAKDFPRVRKAWREYVKENNGEGVVKAFSDLIASTPAIHSIGINWSSVNYFYDTFGKDDSECYDFVADYDKIESEL